MSADPAPHGSVPYQPGAAPLPLARAGLDRAAHLRDDEGWLAQAWARPSTQVLVVEDGRVLARFADDGRARLVLVRPDEAPQAPRYLLGVDADGVAHFAVPGPLPDPAGSDCVAVGLREVGSVLGDTDAGLLVHAVALDAWHRAHPRCSRCGAPTEVASAGHVRRCPADGSEHFPRTDPAVIMLVVHEDGRCLLGRQRRWPPSRFSTLAGFVEPGESLEQAVAREVAEEVGLAVCEARYVASQPWPFPSSLMLGFVARVEGVDVQVDGDEIAEARWFTRDGLRRAVETGEVRLPPPVSIARRLVEGWYGSSLASPTSW